MQIVYGKSDGHGGFAAGFDSTVSAAAQTQLNAVKALYESTFVDPIKINIAVSFGTAGLASTLANIVTGVAYRKTFDGTDSHPRTGKGTGKGTRSRFFALRSQEFET